MLKGYNIENLAESKIKAYSYRSWNSTMIHHAMDTVIDTGKQLQQ